MNINSKKDWEKLEKVFTESILTSFFCESCIDFERSWENDDFEKDLKSKASNFLEIHSEWSSLFMVMFNYNVLFYLNPNEKFNSRKLSRLVRLEFIRWMIKNTK